MYTYIQVYLCIHVYVYTHTHAHTHTHIHVHMCVSMWVSSVHVNVYDLSHYSQGLRNVFKGNAGATHDNEFNFNIIMNTHDKHSFI